jgi:beta-glucosidase-like glycosyl hydrolase
MVRRWEGNVWAPAIAHYKINHLLREVYGWDGYILTDFGILTSKNYGVEDLTMVEKMLATLEAGCDAFGGERRRRAGKC